MSLTHNYNSQFFIYTILTSISTTIFHIIVCFNFPFVFLLYFFEFIHFSHFDTQLAAFQAKAVLYAVEIPNNGKRNVTTPLTIVPHTHILNIFSQASLISPNLPQADQYLPPSVYIISSLSIIVQPKGITNTPSQHIFILIYLLQFIFPYFSIFFIYSFQLVKKPKFLVTFPYVLNYCTKKGTFQSLPKPFLSPYSNKFNLYILSFIFTS